MVAFNDPMQWGEETAPSADGRLSKWKSLCLKYIELHMISKEHLVVLVVTMPHFCYHASSNWLTSYISLAGVFCGKAGRGGQWRKVFLYPVRNPLGVTASSRTLGRKLSEDPSVSWQNGFQCTLPFQLRICMENCLEDFLMFICALFYFISIFFLTLSFMVFLLWPYFVQK